MTKLAPIYGLLAATVLVAGSANPYRINAAHMKGYRAVIMHGGPLDERVWVEWDEATKLYAALFESLHYGAPYPQHKLENRPCFGIAVFRRTGYALNWRVDELRPQDADLKYWFYPAIGDEPAVTSFSRAALPQLLEKLTSYDIPVRLPKTEAGSCNAQPVNR